MTTSLPTTLAELERERILRGSLVEFVKRGWHVVETVEYIHDRHIDEICKHLVAVSLGKCDRLVINIPPGCSKSSIVSVLWPAWHWAVIDGTSKWMHTSFDLGLSRRDAEKCQNLIQSDWYQDRFGPEATHIEDWYERLGRAVPKGCVAGVRLGFIAPGEKTKSGKESKRSQAVTIFKNSHKGLRFSTMMRGKATGWHAHFQVCDDPNKPDEIKNGGEDARKALARTRNLWQGTFSSRKADPKRFARVVIMQRLHFDDLAATCVAEGYVHLCLPMEYDPDRHCTTPYGGDWRKVKGELLCPNRYDAASVAMTKKDMGPKVAAAQLQQNPLPEGGTTFQGAWLLRRWEVLPHDAVYFQSWDCTFKGGADSDWVVGQVWARAGGAFYLVDQVRERMGFVETVQAIRDLHAKWPECGATLIEDKANGSAVIDYLSLEIPGVLGIDPKGGKESRANSVSPFFAAGNVYFPEGAWFLTDLISEMTRFPLAATDDQVDALSQALTWAHSEGWFVHALGQAMAAGMYSMPVYR